ncbi:MAG: DNA gyrase subunit A [Bacteroidetes bacterium]|nr:DNA gyrase subunit A [Bacteroidota bacterium]
MEPENNPRIIPINIEEEMKSSYIDYSMSVIVSRALPDVRDGLKPVHRRVLYAMNEQGMGAGSAYKKSARVVGEVLGKYHPHGDSAIYDTMVRMAQEFSLRYPMVDGQGNFGSVDGDGAAAMRYTEARMTRLAEELLRDLNKETVDFQDNFDGSLQEPQVLPSAIPSLLINGSDGIAVGMATKIPPHNITESINATVAYIDNPDITIDELVEIMPAPDFPTGGIIYGHTEVRQAYHTGRGRVVMRARIHEEEIRPGRYALIATEIPYQVNKSSLIEKIAMLARDKRIEGISDLRDESDRDGMRIVIELKRDAVPMVVQNQLFKYTQFQQTFGMNVVALVHGRPRTLNLKQMIKYYVEHRHEVVQRRTQFELRKAQERAHVLEGLKIALDHLDAVISIIRHSADVDEARANLMNGVFPQKLTTAQLERLGLPTHGDSMFTLSEIQAKAILDLRLNRLTGLERQKIEDEFEAILKEIERLNAILAEEGIRMSTIKSELIEMRDKYGDDRRTEIDYTGGGDIFIEDLIDDEQVIVTISHQGLIKRTSASEYEAQGRGGVGRRGTSMRDEDFVEHLFVGNNHDYLLFFTDQGRCYWLRIYEIPEGTRIGKGRSIRNCIQIGPEDRIRAIVPVAKEDFRNQDFLNSHYVLMATKSGQVKKTQLESFSRPRVDGIIAISIDEGDELLEAHLTDGSANVIIASSSGVCIRFQEKDARPMGRNTRGVRGIRLTKGSEVIGMIVMDDEARDILTISANGYGKRTALEEYRLQSRGGKGIIAQKTTAKTGPIVAIKGVLEKNDLMISTVQGIMIRMDIGAISRLGRNTQGVRVIKLRGGDSIADVTKVIVEDEDIESAVMGEPLDGETSHAQPDSSAEQPESNDMDSDVDKDG